MSLKHEITKKAADGCLTIPELRQFLDEFDKATPPGTSPYPGGEALKPKARVRFSGSIKSITVTIPGRRRGGEQER